MRSVIESVYKRKLVPKGQLSPIAQNYKIGNTLFIYGSKYPKTVDLAQKHPRKITKEECNPHHSYKPFNPRTLSTNVSNADTCLR
jgi:hypothetical protein